MRRFFLYLELEDISRTEETFFSQLFLFNL